MTAGPPRMHTAPMGPGITPTCTLCAVPCTFKTYRSLRSHHNRHHPDAGTLVLVRSMAAETRAAETRIAPRAPSPAYQG